MPEPNTPPPDAPDSEEAAPARPRVELPADPGVAATFETLLKNPAAVAAALLGGKSGGRLVSNLSLTAVVCLAVFGVVVGAHSAGTQLWAAPLKITVGTFLAGLICLPSLYIFACLSGLDVRFKTVVGLLAAALCLIALLLLGFAPVVWIFSQSTESVAFLGLLVLLFWTVAAWFGLGLVVKAAEAAGVENRSHLVVWIGIFILVAMQMSTSLRPIIGSSDELLTSEKKFFLVHWSEQMQEAGKTVSKDGVRLR
jgi:hypothetical protein